jgi:hypothetical protein
MASSRVVRPREVDWRVKPRSDYRVGVRTLAVRRAATARS